MSDSDPTPENEASTDDDSDLVDVAAMLEDQTERRLWVRTLVPLLQLRSHDSDPSGRVQLAFDLMHISVCDKVRGLLGGGNMSGGQ